MSSESIIDFFPFYSGISNYGRLHLKFGFLALVTFSIPCNPSQVFERGIEARQRKIVSTLVLCYHFLWTLR